MIQLGFTMSEEMVFTDGQLRNSNFADYKIPGIRDMPAVMTGESVAARQESGPYTALQGCRRDRHVRRVAGHRQRDS